MIVSTFRALGTVCLWVCLALVFIPASLGMWFDGTADRLGHR